MLPLQILIIIIFPAFSQWLTAKLKVQKWLSPVVLCYATGILLANIGNLEFSASVNTLFSQGTVLLAIPLLLYSTDLLGWLKYAKTTLVSFGLCVLSGLIMSMIMAFLWQDVVEDTWILSGMLVGVFTGGMANLQAIGMGLGADESLFVLINAGDIFAGGIYLILLTSVMHPILGYFLPDFQLKNQKNQTPEELTNSSFHWQDTSVAIALSIAILLAAVGLTHLLTGAIKSESLIILLLTTFSIVASFFTKIRTLRGAFSAGEYALLMFCVAIGLQANLDNILEHGTTVVFYTTAILFGTGFFHLFLCWLFKIDRDTAMITATAAIYGPPFIGQVASAINNRTLVFSGIATGLVGYALGNYLGIGIGNFLKWLMF